MEVDGDSLINLTESGPESGATRIVLFYATWCGHCAHFASEYEMVAEVFSTVPSLSFLAIDCNEYRETCRSAGVDRYPTLVGYRDGEKTGPEWDRRIRAADYVNEQLPERLQLAEIPTTEHLRGAPVEMKESKGEGKSDTAEARVHDGVLAFANLMATAVFPAGRDSLEGDRLDTLKYVVLPTVATLHPDEGFRGEIADIGEELRSVYSLARDQWMALLADKPLLGGEIALSEALAPESHWKVCGQLSCGLWQLLHHLTLGVDRPYNGQKHQNDLTGDRTGLAAMTGIKAIVSQYFACEECRRHFVEDYDKCLYGRCVDGDSPTREETVMWLWRFHNAVNGRVFAHRSPGGDVRKAQWPPASTCPPCVSSATGEYSEKIVYHWIVRTYLGDMLKGETPFTMATSPVGFAGLGSHTAASIWPARYGEVWKC